MSNTHDSTATATASASSAVRSPRPVDFYCGAVYRPDESIGFLMKRVLMSIVQQADRRLEAHGLTSAQWGPLLRLKTTGGSTVAELARWLQMDAGAMTRLLDRLEKKGLCKRVRSTEDRRVVQVELTPEGEASIVEVPTVLSEVLNAHLAGFSKTEWMAMRGYLTRMLKTGEALRDGA
jgi:DNA-binding MarR family transcriptional regulator